MSQKKLWILNSFETVGDYGNFCCSQISCISHNVYYQESIGPQVDGGILTKNVLHMTLEYLVPSCWHFSCRLRRCVRTGKSIFQEVGFEVSKQLMMASLLFDITFVSRCEFSAITQHPQ